jgi:hypothetical protein
MLPLPLLLIELVKLSILGMVREDKSIYIRQLSGHGKVRVVPSSHFLGSQATFVLSMCSRGGSIASNHQKHHVNIHGGEPLHIMDPLVLLIGRNPCNVTTGLCDQLGSSNLHTLMFCYKLRSFCSPFRGFLSSEGFDEVCICWLYHVHHIILSRH